MATAKKTNKAETKSQKKKKSDGLFEGYGEFDSYAEINATAEGFLKEGDLKSLRDMAKENGLEDEAEIYIQSEGKFQMCNASSAAVGKLKVEITDDEQVAILRDYTQSKCDDIKLAEAIRKKGKRFKEAYKKVGSYAREHQSSGVAMLYKDTMFGIVKDYYLGGEK